MVATTSPAVKARSLKAQLDELYDNQTACLGLISYHTKRREWADVRDCKDELERVRREIDRLTASRGW